MNDDNIDKIPPSDLPNVVLVKKRFANKALRNRKRKWKLRHLQLDDLDSQNKLACICNFCINILVKCRGNEN